jgi:hypothetical protein
MAILFRRLLVSVLVPFLWKRWRERRNEPAATSGPRRSLGRSEPRTA